MLFAAVPRLACPSDRAGRLEVAAANATDSRRRCVELLARLRSFAILVSRGAAAALEAAGYNGIA